MSYKQWVLLVFSLLCLAIASAAVLPRERQLRWHLRPITPVAELDIDRQKVPSGVAEFKGPVSIRLTIGDNDEFVVTDAMHATIVAAGQNVDYLLIFCKDVEPEAVLNRVEALADALGPPHHKDSKNLRSWLSDPNVFDGDVYALGWITSVGTTIIEITAINEQHGVVWRSKIKSICAEPFSPFRPVQE